MKSYPSISRVDPDGWDHELFTFDKLDGSNIRYEYSRKQGWYKFGSRTRLLDKTDPILGPAIPLFMDTLAEPIAKVVHDNKWESITVFAEFWGKNSLAGRHVKEDQKFVTLFDAAPYKKGMLPPEEFLKHFGNLNIPNFLGVRVWDSEFVNSVKASSIDGITLEGVVGKNSKLTMVKCKTNKWLDEIKRLYSEDEARRLINS